MILIRLTLILVVLATTSCHKSITERMVNVIEENCSSKDTCYVDLLLVEPAWDHLYVFSPATTRDELLKVLPRSNFDPEIRGLIVLTKDSMVIDSEYLRVELEGRTKLEFAFPFDRNIMIFTKEQSLALVKVVSYKNKPYYEISRSVSK